MTRREQMIASLRSRRGEFDMAFAAQLQADGETIARLEAQISEWSKCNLAIVAKCSAVERENAQLRWDLDAGMKAAHDLAFAHHQRQATEIASLTTARDAAISALAEEGRKRGEAEAIIAEMLRLDHDGSEEEWRAICGRARAILRPADKGDAM